MKLFVGKGGFWDDIVSDKSPTSMRVLASFAPRPNLERLRMFEKHIKIESDDDVWVERFYMNTSGHNVYYYRSLRTNRCVLLQPPTGAACIVSLIDLHHYPELEDFALGPLDRNLRDIEKPQFTYHTTTSMQWWLKVKGSLRGICKKRHNIVSGNTKGSNND